MIGFRDYLDRLNQADGVADAGGVWSQAMAEMGFSHHMIGFFGREDGADTPGPVSLTNYDPGWLREYEARFQFVDPMLRRALVDDLPFAWSSVRPANSAERDFVKASQDVLGPHGISSKLAGAPGRAGAFSVCGPDQPDADRFLERVFALSAAAHMQMTALEQREARGFVRLTPRQRECLQWLATDLDVDGIADKMGIGSAGVISHIKSIYQEFGVHKRVTAVTLGLAWGLIELPPWGK